MVVALAEPSTRSKPPCSSIFPVLRIPSAKACPRSDVAVAVPLTSSIPLPSLTLKPSVTSPKLPFSTPIARAWSRSLAIASPSTKSVPFPPISSAITSKPIFSIAIFNLILLFGLIILLLEFRQTYQVQSRYLSKLFVLISIYLLLLVKTKSQFSQLLKVTVFDTKPNKFGIGLPKPS